MAETLIKFAKFLIALSLLPVLIAITLSAHSELLNLDNLYYTFHWGVMTYLIFHLFLYIPEGLYQAGQRVFSELFKFSQFVVALVTYCIPFYATLTLVVLYITSMFLDMSAFVGYFIFFAGFSAAMHIILTAQDLYQDDDTILKPNYVSSIILIYIVNIFMMSFLMHLNFEQFSFSLLTADLADRSTAIYLSVFEQLFKP